MVDEDDEDEGDSFGEIAGGVMASVFQVLGLHGLDASDGTDDAVGELDVEITVYGL